LEEAFRLVDCIGAYKSETRYEMKDIPKEGMTGELRLSMVKEMIKNYIHAHYAEDISMNDLAMKMNYSEAYFCKLFKQCFKMNFTTYLANHRMEKAKSMLEDPLTNVKVVGISCGYPDSNYFARVFKRATGLTPTEYRKKKMNEKWKK
jgi:YesN/AraC family two-component response regulator